MVASPRIAFLGTPEFAVPSLRALIAGGMAPSVVITRPDSPVGRHQDITPSAVKVAALDAGLPIAQPKNSAELVAVLTEHKITVGVVVAFGQIISSKALAVPVDGILNIHPSLLPKYRGASPIQSAILNGDRITGVSIIKLVEALDAGPIVSQVETDITDSDTAEILSARLSEVGAKLLVETLPRYLSKELIPVSQDESKVTMTKQLLRDDGRISWQKSAAEINCQFRAFYPWPGVFTHIAGKRLKIEDLSVLGGSFEPGLRPGQVFEFGNGGMAVMTGSGAVELKKIRPEGRTSVDGSAYLRANKNLTCEVLT